MSNTIRISKEEYDVLMEQKHNCLFCKKNMFFNCERVEDIYNSREQLKKQLVEKNETIKRGLNEVEELKRQLGVREEYIDVLNNKLSEQNETIKRQNQQLTEKELYEKKAKETAPTGVPAIDATVDRLIKLEAKFEAKENPYFF